MQILALLPIVAIVAAHNSPEEPTTTITYDTTWPSTDLRESTTTIIHTNPSQPPKSTYTAIYTNTTRGPDDGVHTSAPTNPSQPPTGSTVTVYVTSCPVYPNTTTTRGPVSPTPSGGGTGPTSPSSGNGPHPNGAAATSYMGANMLVGLVGVVVLAGLL